MRPPDASGPRALSITHAAADEQAVVANLMQLYFHDFSEHAWFQARHMDDGHVAEDGRFRLRSLPQYWRDEDRAPLLFRSGGKLLGFALLNKWSATGQPVDWSVGEFFILRRIRNRGFGLAAATTVIRARPGVWEIPVAAGNAPALAFWRRVVARLAPDRPTLIGDGERWHGEVFRFIMPG